MEAASCSETFVILPTNSASFTISPLETSARRFVKFAWQFIILVYLRRYSVGGRIIG
jgi:hypothetical protein